MFCPVLEHEIQAHKKAAEMARELSHTGYCYIEVTTKSSECLISEIVSMACGEFKNAQILCSNWGSESRLLRQPSGWENYYGLSDLNIINYSEVCDWCNFPDLQDGGIYEQAIDVARYRSITHWPSRGTEAINGRRQEIRYSKRNARPFITMFGKRLYIGRFIRNNF